MDRTELRKKLEPFFEKCEENGKPIREFYIVEAFPGVSGSSYNLKIKAPWIDKISSSEALDFLLEILWETTDIETRISIFAIVVLNSDEDFNAIHEMSEQIYEPLYEMR